TKLPLIAVGSRALSGLLGSHGNLDLALIAHIRALEADGRRLCGRCHGRHEVKGKRTLTIVVLSKRTLVDFSHINVKLLAELSRADRLRPDLSVDCVSCTTLVDPRA